MIQDQNFGIEIEMTGLSRYNAAKIIAEYFISSVRYKWGHYEEYFVLDSQDRKWSIKFDGSIHTQMKIDGHISSVADSDYSVELVSPICRYEDIPLIQEIVRNLRQRGAITNSTTGIHVHVDASRYDANSLKNLTNIMWSKEELLYKALQIKERREERYCKKIDEDFIQRLNSEKPETAEGVKDIWYNGHDGSNMHYHESRYHALNLHSVFQKGTVEFRLFNGTLHAGKVKTYIQLSLAISNQALSQKRARFIRTESTNEKYTFRTWLLRLGMIGKEFETARMFLLEHLEGNIAWKDVEQIEKQKQRLAQRKAEQAENSDTASVIDTEPEQIDEEFGIELM